MESNSTPRFCFTDDDAKVTFYTGFPSYEHLRTNFDFLGPAAKQLILQGFKASYLISAIRDVRTVYPLLKNSFSPSYTSALDYSSKILQGIAHRFGISQLTVSRIFTSWINFLYPKFMQLPLWPPREYIHTFVPKLFREQYPTTRVIIDATEIFVQQSSLPELQQHTFTSYNYHNTFKGISPSGVVIFVSKLYPGNISDIELTCWRAWGRG